MQDIWSKTAGMNFANTDVTKDCFGLFPASNCALRRIAPGFVGGPEAHA